MVNSSSREERLELCRKLGEAYITVYAVNVQCPHCQGNLLVDSATYEGESDLYVGDLVICPVCDEKSKIIYTIVTNEFWASKRPAHKPRLFAPDGESCWAMTKPIYGE